MIKTKQKIYKKWIVYVDADLDMAKTAYRSAVHRKKTDWPIFMLIIWHCQQVVEKMLKMVIVIKGKELPYIHDLIKLLEIAKIENFPLEFRELLQKLSKYYVKPRYPDITYKNNYPRADYKLSKKYLNDCKAIYLWLKKYVSHIK